MMTLSAMAIKTNWMMEEIRRKFIDDTFDKWEHAVRNYYINGCDNGETVYYCRILQNEGVDTEAIIDKELEIREEVLGF